MALLPDDDPVRYWSVRRRGRLVLPRHLDRIVVQATEFQDGQWRAAHADANVHENDLGCDPTSLDTKTGTLQLIEVKGIGAAGDTVILTPNKHRVAQDRSDYFWLNVVTNCNAEPKLPTVKDPASQSWQPVQKALHCTIAVGLLAGAAYA